MRPLRPLGLALVLVSVTALPARADLTAFIGVQGSPSSRPTTGVAVGSGVLVLGFEIEYAQVHADDNCFTGTAACAPSLRTGMFNALVQTPRGVVPRSQLYVAVGAGYFRERFESLDLQTTGVATNIGGGAKIQLVGPLRIRLDYRIFKLGSGAVYNNPQRFTVGVNVAF
jgi:opacity protein-like surface antigen